MFVIDMFSLSTTTFRSYSAELFPILPVHSLCCCTESGTVKPSQLCLLLHLCQRSDREDCLLQDKLACERWGPVQGKVGGWSTSLSLSLTEHAKSNPGVSNLLVIMLQQATPFWTKTALQQNRIYQLLSWDNICFCWLREMDKTYPAFQILRLL